MENRAEGELHEGIDLIHSFDKNDWSCVCVHIFLVCLEIPQLVVLQPKERKCGGALFIFMN